MGGPAYRDSSKDSNIYGATSFFYHANNIPQNINFTMDEQTNGKLEFLDTLLK